MRVSQSSLSFEYVLRLCLKYEASSQRVAFKARKQFADTLTRGFRQGQTPFQARNLEQEQALTEEPFSRLLAEKRRRRA